jgi:hypothetical protein
VVAPGLMVAAIILFMGAVSGAHLNPAVSLAFAVRRDFPWGRVPGYIVTQLLGATLACLFLLAVIGNVEHLGATLPGAGYEDWQAFLMEIVLTAGLLSVILGTASGAERRQDRRARGRRLHRPCGPVVGAGERQLDEPSSLVWPGVGQRRLDGLLSVRRRPVARRGDRNRVRCDPAGPRRGPDLSRSPSPACLPRPLAAGREALERHRQREGSTARFLSPRAQHGVVAQDDRP